MKIEIKVLNNHCTPSQKGDWIDLRSGKSFTLRCGDFAIIPLGVAMRIPHGYEAIIVPRSSLFKNHGIIQTNSIGVIDEAYSGDKDEWGLPVFATRDTIITEGERICQFRLLKHQPCIKFKPVIHLGKSRGGFGSTGKM